MDENYPNEYLARDYEIMAQADRVNADMHRQNGWFSRGEDEMLRESVDWHEAEAAQLRS